MAREPGGDNPRAVGGDLVLPVAAVAFTIYYFWSIWESPWEARVAAFLIGSILILLVAILLVRTLKDILVGEASLGLGELAGPAWVMPRRLVLLALTLGYVIGLDWLGFTLTSFLFLFAGMLTLSDARGDPRKIIHYGIVSAILSLAGWALFIVAFDTRFPAGPFEELMGAMFGL
jgi:hypothetical protein